MTRCTARAVCFSKSSLCFFTGLPMVVVAVVAARAVSVVVVLAVTPAVGVWEDERVRTGVSGGDWLPAVMNGGALPMTSCLGDGSLGSFLFFRPSRPEWSSPKSMTSSLSDSESRPKCTVGESVSSFPFSLSFVG